MDLDEWSKWQQTIPEIVDWFSDEIKSKDCPLRADCLNTIEEHAFNLTTKQFDDFLSMLTTFTLHKLDDSDIELMIRIILEYKNGRGATSPLREIGRRLATEAEKRHYVKAGYLLPFREIVNAEFN